jgi:hypothetical protein
MLFAALDSAAYGASTVLYVPLSVRLGTGPDGYSYLLIAVGAGIPVVGLAGLPALLRAARTARPSSGSRLRPRRSSSPPGR